MIWGDTDHPTESVDNIAAALERSDRVRHINLPRLYLETFSATMQVLFPELTVLELHSNGKWMPVLPDSFLGGSASHLQSLTLKAIPFPGLPKLLLSATNLAHLFLFDIPHSGYFTPEAMVTALYTLTGFQLLLLQFQSSLSRPDRPSQRPPPSTRSVLPVLAYFFFSGVPEYFDDIVAGMDTPRLDHLSINLFNQIKLDTPQFVQFISRAPTFGAFKEARHFFKNDHARVELFSQTPVSGGLHLDILCGDVGWQMSSLGQVFTSCLPPLSTLEDLYIVDSQDSHLHRPDNIENTLWLELLRPFASVMNLYLSRKVARCIVPALQELVGARTMEVLPNLQNIFLEHQPWQWAVQEGIGKFAAMRQVAGHPIAISYSRWANPWP